MMIFWKAVQRYTLKSRKARDLGLEWDLLWGLVGFPRFCPYLQKKQQRLVTTAVDVPSYDVPRFTSMSLPNTSGFKSHVRCNLISLSFLNHCCLRMLLCVADRYESTSNRTSALSGWLLGRCHSTSLLKLLNILIPIKNPTYASEWGFLRLIQEPRMPFLWCHHNTKVAK